MADAELLPVEQLLEALHALRDRIAGSREVPLDFKQLAGQQASTSERVLLDNCESSLALLRTLTPVDLELVKATLITIAGGQELDLRRFPGTSAQNITALLNDEELDAYTYMVAGCVGAFWTRMCRTHVFPRDRIDDALLIENGVRFGKGLQLVNILRDVPTDLRRGRCYLPADRLSATGLAAKDLLDPANETRLRPL